MKTDLTMDETTVWEKIPLKIIAAVSALGTALVGAIWKMYLHPRIKSKQSAGIAHDESDELIEQQRSQIVSSYEKLWQQSEERAQRNETLIEELRQKLLLMQERIVQEQSNVMRLEIQIESLENKLKIANKRIAELEQRNG